MEVHNSSEVSHIEMNFQNQESKPSGRNLESAEDDSLEMRDGHGQVEYRSREDRGHQRGNIDQEEASYQSDDNRNRMSYMVSNQDGRP